MVAIFCIILYVDNFWINFLNKFPIKYLFQNEVASEDKYKLTILWPWKKDATSLSTLSTEVNKLKASIHQPLWEQKICLK